MDTKDTILTEEDITTHKVELCKLFLYTYHTIPPLEAYKETEKCAKLFINTFS